MSKTQKNIYDLLFYQHTETDRGNTCWETCKNDLLPHISIIHYHRYEKPDKHALSVFEIKNESTGSRVRGSTRTDFHSEVYYLIDGFDLGIKPPFGWYGSWLHDRHRKCVSEGIEAITDCFGHSPSSMWLRCYDGMVNAADFSWHERDWVKHPLVFDWWMDEFNAKYPEVELPEFVGDCIGKYDHGDYHKLMTDFYDWLQYCESGDYRERMEELLMKGVSEIYLNATNAPNLFTTHA